MDIMISSFVIGMIILDNSITFGFPVEKSKHKEDIVTSSNLRNIQMEKNMLTERVANNLDNFLNDKKKVSSEQIQDDITSTLINILYQDLLIKQKREHLREIVAEKFKKSREKDETSAYKFVTNRIAYTNGEKRKTPPGTWGKDEMNKPSLTTNGNEIEQQFSTTGRNKLKKMSTHDTGITNEINSGSKYAVKLLSPRSNNEEVELNIAQRNDKPPEKEKNTGPPGLWGRSMLREILEELKREAK